MKRVTIEVDERYASLLTIYALGDDECGYRCIVGSFDPDKVNHVRIDENGKIHTRHVKEGSDEDGEC